ncbi:GM12102 [Drosophila sechellia]|uniref:GM12102 n=1 Tax=Drosophila sechellia TaxID=7238 RepID=B4HZZ5_DROSE|nr:GM12102 [Drosophila sechellia]
MLSQLLQAFQRLVSQLKSQFVWVRCWLPIPRHFYGFRRETESRARLRLRLRERLRRNPAERASHQRNRRTQRRHLVMDYIFECFFDDTFEQISRNGLQDRQSRRDVLDHLSSIIKGCSGGQNSQTDEVAAIAVTAAMRYHRMAKEQNGQVCLMGKYHNILYIGLRTCWDWGVRDSEVVVKLLVSIYECEKTYERIFLGALFGPHAPHFIAGWRSDFQDQHENVRAMVYFLKHATREQLTLPVWIPRFEQERQLRFIDVPIESCGKSSPLRIALQANAPELLLILLRYGAAPKPPDGGASVIIALLDKLIEDGRNYSFELVMCLKILLRNVVMIEMPFKVYGVPSLRHLCRCCIRDVLRMHNQLPNGIDTLRLPKRLQRYIDLTEELEGPEAQDTEDKDQQREKSSAKCKLGSEVARLDTISSAGESEDESENQAQLLQAVTDPEKAALAAFMATGDGAYTEEACPPDFDPDFPPISLPGEPR